MNGQNFWKKFIISFFITAACIGIAVGTLGILFQPDAEFGYEAFFFPPVLALLCMIPSFTMYSRREYTTGERILREVIHLLLIELVIFAVNQVNGAHTSPIIPVTVALSVFIIYVVVGLVNWLNDYLTARQFNRELRRYKAREQSSLCR